MPKKIKNAREIILETSENLLFELGYKGFTIREVAKRCHIATGTIFNYFESKEMLIATIMAKDWSNYLEDIHKECNKAKDIAAGVAAIYRGIEGFSKKYEPIWTEYSGNLIGYFGKHHKTLCKQITEILNPLLVRFNIELDMSVIYIFAETILASSVQRDIDLSALLKFTALLFS